MAAAASRILIDATMARRGGGFTYLVNLLPRLAGLTKTTTAFDLFARSHSNLYGLSDVAPLHQLLREVGFASIGETNIIPGGSVRYLWARTAK